MSILHHFCSSQHVFARVKMRRFCSWRSSSASRRAGCWSGLGSVPRRCTIWCWAAGRGSRSNGSTLRRFRRSSALWWNPLQSTWTSWASHSDVRDHLESTVHHCQWGVNGSLTRRSLWLLPTYWPLSCFCIDGTTPIISQYSIGGSLHMLLYNLHVTVMYFCNYMHVLPPH